jgi:hypothetical protein
MDNDIRKIILKNIDNVLENPKQIEKGYCKNIVKLGIEPTLETVLSYFSGLLLGTFIGYYMYRYDRAVTEEEINEFHDLMKRYTGTLRETFLQTRLEEK